MNYVPTPNGFEYEIFTINIDTDKFAVLVFYCSPDIFI